MLNWLEVDRQKLLGNLKRVKARLLDDVKVMAVVKANAYGHGLIEVARIFEPEVDWLAVVEIAEAVKLREAGIEKPILVLGYIEDNDFEHLFQYQITPAVYSFEVMKKLTEKAKNLGQKIQVHVKIDTGMNRMGFREGELDSLIQKLKGNEYLKVSGLYSHFYNEHDEGVVGKQYGIMERVVKKFRENGWSDVLVHLAKSRVALSFCEAQFDMVRVGGILYGLVEGVEGIEPAAEFKAKIGVIKKVEKGMAVGYDGCFIAPKNMTVAVVTAGYADGFRSFAENTGKVLVDGKICPVVGRICMNQAMVDVAEVDNLEVGQEVVLIGAQGSQSIWPWDYAKETKCVPYESIARIPEHVARVYKG